METQGRWNVQANEYKIRNRKSIKQVVKTDYEHIMGMLIYIWSTFELV